jgi:hypothetical protein
VRMRSVSYLLRGMVDRTCDNVATPLCILDLPLEDGHHSAHKMSLTWARHHCRLLAGPLSLHRCLAKIEHRRTGRGVSLGLLSMKDVKLCLGICIQVMSVVYVEGLIRKSDESRSTWSTPVITCARMCPLPGSIKVTCFGIGTGDTKRSRIAGYGIAQMSPSFGAAGSSSRRTGGNR